MIHGQNRVVSKSESIDELLAVVECGLYWMCKLNERRYTAEWEAHHADAV